MLRLWVLEHEHYMSLVSMLTYLRILLTAVLSQEGLKWLDFADSLGSLARLSGFKCHPLFRLPLAFAKSRARRQVPSVLTDIAEPIHLFYHLACTARGVCGTAIPCPSSPQ